MKNAGLNLTPNCLNGTREALPLIVHYDQMLSDIFAECTDGNKSPAFCRIIRPTYKQSINAPCTDGNAMDSSTIFQAPPQAA